MSAASILADVDPRRIVPIMMGRVVRNRPALPEDIHLEL
jgi:hypothetical protein